MPSIDFFLELASTYTYPAAMRVSTLANASGVKVRWRPFLLGPIFKAQGWTTSPFNLFPTKGRYMWRDLERICADLTLPFAKPEVFPQSSVLAARVAHVGLEEGWGEEFCRAVLRAEFSEGRSIDDESVLAELVTAQGASPVAVFARTKEDDMKARLRATTAEAERLGVFGAPTFVVGDELFWGNDRLEAAFAWAKRAP